MKKLLTLIVLGSLVSMATGCRIAECWRYAWNSRFPQRTQQTVVVSDPCVVESECYSPCASSCGSACTPAAPATMAPTPVPSR
jgi:hypothetical protein